MIYIEIPYVSENNRIDKLMAKKEIQILAISDSAKQGAYEAIYNLNPRGVSFDTNKSVEASLLEKTLKRLGVPYRKSEDSQYYTDKYIAG